MSTWIVVVLLGLSMTMATAAALILARFAYRREWDLTALRFVMHRFGVHTSACRGWESCAPTYTSTTRLYANGWWRR